MVTAAWLYHDLPRVQCSSRLLSNKDPPFLQFSDVNDDNDNQNAWRMLDKKKKAYGQKRHHQALGDKAAAFNNEIFLSRHLQIEIGLWLSLWNSSNSWDCVGGVVYRIWLLRTNIFLPLESQRLSELYEDDPAVWKLWRLKETILNITGNIQATAQ